MIWSISRGSNHRRNHKLKFDYPIDCGAGMDQQEFWLQRLAMMDMEWSGNQATSFGWCPMED